MLVRYRTNSTCTLANLQGDINAIITGQITSTAQLSSGADKVNSVIYGSYPSGVYTRVNGTTYTYSKVHSTDASYTHYFRLTYSGSAMTGFSIAQSYTSGTDTLVNSTSKTMTVSPYPYDSFYKTTIDIIINNKGFFILAPSMNSCYGIIDIGHNSITRTYTNSILMMGQDFTDLSTTLGTPNLGGKLSYCYSFDTLSYATLTTSMYTLSPTRKQTSTIGTQVIENPIYAASTATGNAYFSIYGVYKIAPSIFPAFMTYKDASNLYRLTVYDHAILVD